MQKPKEQPKNQPERQKAHSWIRIYANRKVPDNRGAMRSFEVKCRYVDVAQHRISPKGSDFVLNGTYTLIIDNIEYTLDGNNPTAVEDALKIHEAFYEKEFEEGKAHIIKTKEDLNKRWMYLRGISTRHIPYGKKGNTDYVQYVKSTTTKGIAKWIATTLTRSYSNLDLSNMLWYIPGTPEIPGGTIKLRSYVKDVVSQTEFDPEPAVRITSSLYFYHDHQSRGASIKKRNSWIKKKAKEIDKELQKLQKRNEPNMKAKRMIADYKKRVA